jgi:hypothetical protein
MPISTASQEVVSKLNAQKQLLMPFLPHHRQTKEASIQRGR